MELKRFRIKSWKLTLLAFIFICFFAGLGNWQLNRAREKEQLLQTFQARATSAPLDASALQDKTDLRFHRVTVQGHFDNTHTLLLDNKIQDGKVGYEIYVPFYADELLQPILVDRGFIAGTANRQQLPFIPAYEGKTSLTGMLNTPPRYVALGNMVTSLPMTWPLRVEYIQIGELAALLKNPIFPLIINIEPHHPAALSIQWQIVTMSPERHRGYAVQWFAFALTLLILSVVLNYDRSR
jgi:surfeit locus 1 family protein